MAPGLSGVPAMLQTEQPISLVDPLRVDGREGLSSRLPSWLLGQSQTVHPTSGQTARLTCGGGACLSYQSVEEEEDDIRQGVEKKRKRKKHVKQGHITYCVQAPGAIPAHKQTAVYCVRVGEGRIPPEPWFFVFFFSHGCKTKAEQIAPMSVDQQRVSTYSRRPLAWSEESVKWLAGFLANHLGNHWGYCFLSQEDKKKQPVKKNSNRSVALKSVDGTTLPFFWKKGRKMVKPLDLALGRTSLYIEKCRSKEKEKKRAREGEWCEWARGRACVCGCVKERSSG